MTRLRVNSFTLSLDGYAAGPGQNLDNPLGVGGIALHEFSLLDTPALGYRCSAQVTTPAATHVVLTRRPP